MDQSNLTFLFIPDITGFTEFVGSTEIEHSRHIISELLELVINSDQLGLSVSEIEGDAVLSFKKGELPSLESILRQCENTFILFHNHLRRYDSERICRCGACETAVDLSLKFIVHAGAVETMDVKGHHKLHGMDVILAHRLLKNNVPAREYVLFTDSFPPPGSQWPVDDQPWVKFENGSDDYEIFGPVNYRFASLRELHNKVVEPNAISIPGLGPDKLTFSARILAPADIIFENFTNFEKRVQWNEEIREIVLKNEKINKAGAIHTCLVGSNTLDIESLGRLEIENRIIYGERLDKFKGLQDILTIYTFEQNGDETLVTVEIDFKTTTLFNRIFKPMISKMISRQTQKGLQQLKIISEGQ